MPRSFVGRAAIPGGIRPGARQVRLRARRRASPGYPRRMLNHQQRLGWGLTLSMTAIILWAAASYLRGTVIWWL